MMDNASRSAEGTSEPVSAAGHGSGAAGRVASRRSHGRRSSHRPGGLTDRVHQRHQRQRLIRHAMTVSLAGLCLLVVALIAVLLRTTTDLRRTRDRLAGEVQAAQARAEQAEETAQRLHLQLAEIVQGRLPKPMLPLVPDQLIALDQPPLRNILFTYAGTADRLGYDYRLTCRNDGAERFQVGIQLLLFNELGIQIGSADVRDSPDWTRLGASGLAPGESAAFSGRVTLQFGDAPKYFLVLTMAPDGRLSRLGP